MVETVKVAAVCVCVCGGGRWVGGGVGGGHMWDGETSSLGNVYLWKQYTNIADCVIK